MLHLSDIPYLTKLVVAPSARVADPPPRPVAVPTGSPAPADYPPARPRLVWRWRVTDTGLRSSWVVVNM